LWGQTLAVITYHKLHHSINAEPFFTFYPDPLHKGGLGLKILDFHIEYGIFNGMPTFFPCVSLFEIIVVAYEGKGCGQWAIFRNILGIEVPIVLYTGRGDQI